MFHVHMVSKAIASKVQDDKQQDQQDDETHRHLHPAWGGGGRSAGGLGYIRLPRAS